MKTRHMSACVQPEGWKLNMATSRTSPLLRRNPCISFFTISEEDNAMQAQRQQLKEAAMTNMQEGIAREVDARRKQLQVTLLYVMLE